MEHAGALEVGHGDGEVTFVIEIFALPNIPEGITTAKLVPFQDRAPVLAVEKEAEALKLGIGAQLGAILFPVYGVKYNVVAAKTSEVITGVFEANVNLKFCTPFCDPDTPT